MDFYAEKKRVRLATGVLFALLLLVSASVLFAGRSQLSVSLKPGDVVSMDDGWYTRGADGAEVPRTLPVRIEPDADGVYRLYRQSSAVDYDQYLSFYVHHQRIRVSLDGMLLYSYEPDIKPAWLRTYRAFHHIVVVPRGMSGELCVETVPMIRSTGGEYGQVFGGDCSRILRRIIRERWYKLAAGAVLFFVGVVLMLSSLAFSVHSRRERTLFYLGALMAVTGVWQLEESRTLQLVFGSPALHWCLEYVLPLLIPFLTLLFLVEIVDARRSVPLRVLALVDFAVVALQVALQLSGAVQLTDSVFLTYVLYVATFVVSAVIINREMDFSSVRVRVLFLASMIAGLLLFVLNSFGIISSSYADALLMLGLLLVFLSLLVAVYQRMSLRFEEIRTAEMYRRLAMVDISTGVGSRAAWYSFIDSFEEDGDATEESCLVLFDMNNLKKTNDTYGHQTGDMVIQALCDCIRRAFEHDGSVYRIGGDEFICFCPKCPQKKAYQMLSEFDGLVSAQSAAEHPFTVAYGASFFIARKKEDFAAAQSEADRRMYECKEAMKSGRS